MVSHRRGQVQGNVMILPIPTAQIVMMHLILNANPKLPMYLLLQSRLRRLPLHPMLRLWIQNDRVATFKEQRLIGNEMVVNTVLPREIRQQLLHSPLLVLVRVVSLLFAFDSRFGFYEKSLT